MPRVKHAACIRRAQCHDPATVPPFDATYSQQQRDALAAAYEDRRIRPARRVVELAAAGELEHQGERLPAFETNVATVRDLARKLRKRRAGEQTSQLAHAAPRDAVERLRRRLVNVADAVLADVERQKPRDVEPEKLRQIARAVREIAALPGPGDPRPAAPGARADGQRSGGETRGGLAGAILAAHRRADTEPAPNTPPPTNNPRQTDHAPDHRTAANNHKTNRTSDEPGSRVRERAAAMGVEL